jgi:hypothetical protein
MMFGISINQTLTLSVPKSLDQRLHMTYFEPLAWLGSFSFDRKTNLQVQAGESLVHCSQTNPDSLHKTPCSFA